MLFRSIKFFVVCAATLPVFAWSGVQTSLMQTAPIKAVGTVEARLHNDIIFNRGGGYNITTQVETGVLDPYVDVTALFGGGDIDFQTGLLGKFNFLPDIPGQVGVSFLSGYIYSRDNKHNVGTLNFGVVVSKKLDSQYGPISPYGGLQLETVFVNSDSTVPITGLVGAKWEPSKTTPWVFYSEFDFQIRKSVFALCLGAGYPF